MELSIFAIVLLLSPITGMLSSTKVDGIARYYEELYLSYTVNDIERLESGSEVVFQLLEERTLDSIEAFTMSKKAVRAFILTIIENPVNDSIDIPSIIGRVESTPANKRVKKKISARLMIALHKYKC